MSDIPATESFRDGDHGLPRFGRDRYYVFPSYGDEFRDMSSFQQSWMDAAAALSIGPLCFWPGFHGGGVLSFPADVPAHTQLEIVLPADPLALSAVYGLVLGNPPAMELGKRVVRVDPDRPPGIAIRWGLAKRVPNPSVAMTVEHVSCLTDERYLLVVPKENRRTLRNLDQIGPWFATFGITTGTPTEGIPAALRAEMQGWFDNPSRRMWLVPMQGGLPNAAWQLAVLCYVAEYWWLSAKGLQNVHFLANIAGAPNFRQFWTSNR